MNSKKLNHQIVFVGLVLVFETLNLATSFALEVSFHIYNRDNPENAEIVRSLKDSKIFHSGKDTKVLIHGWMADCTQDFAIPNKNAWIKMLDCNVVCVDWSVEAKYLTKAVTKVESVAEFVFNDFEKIIDPDKIHFLGHSLGAQISGVIGHFYRNQKNIKIGQITALDPALINMPYSKFNTTKLAVESAKLVDVIHTEIQIAGCSQPHGHFDFYPNGGLEQPGCEKSLGCSHSRSHQLLTRLILNPYAYPARKCDSLELLKKNVCHEPNGVYMGNIQTYKEPGLYYVDTPDFDPETVPRILIENDTTASTILQNNKETNHDIYIEEEVTAKNFLKKNIQKHSVDDATDDNEFWVHSAGQTFKVHLNIFKMLLFILLLKVFI